MLNTKTRFVLLLAGLAMASSVFAAGVPTNVGRVDANVENGKLVVEWDAASDDDGIAAYRIYYSRKSILDNGGDYDDFEQTPNEETRYEFPEFPLDAGQTIYVSVLAVNTSGIESEAFETEVSVELPSENGGEPTVQEDPQPAEEQPAEDQQPAASMSVTSTATPDNTTVELTFSETLAEEQQLGPGFFIIVDEEGGLLDITDYAKEGNVVRLKTAEQTEGKNYILGVLQRLTGESGASIDGSAPQVSFSGAPKPAEGSSSSSEESSESSEASSEPSSSSSVPADVYGRNPNLPRNNVAGTQNFLDLLRSRTQGGQISTTNPNRDTVPPEDASALRLQPVLRSDGTYNVTAEWRGSPDRAGDLAGYSVATTDDGYAYVRGSVVGANQTSVRYTGLQPGTFGVRVQSVDDAGNRSAGVDKVITLPESGLGLVGIAAVSGLAAARKLRRKRQA